MLNGFMLWLIIYYHNCHPATNTVTLTHTHKAQRTMPDDAHRIATIAAPIATVPNKCLNPTEKLFAVAVVVAGSFLSVRSVLETALTCSHSYVRSPALALTT